MATLQLEMIEPIVQWYTNATHEQKQHITKVVADINGDSISQPKGMSRTHDDFFGYLYEL